MLCALYQSVYTGMPSEQNHTTNHIATFEVAYYGAFGEFLRINGGDENDEFTSNISDRSTSPHLVWSPTSDPHRRASAVARV